MFVHKNGFTANKLIKKKTPGKRRGRQSKKSQVDSLIDGIKDQQWYQSFRKLWGKLEAEIQVSRWRFVGGISILRQLFQDLLDSNYSQVLADLKGFLEDSDHEMCQDLFPVAVLLTGINQPDHYEQFEMLSEKIAENDRVRSTILMSRDASSLKSAIEHLVNGFISEEVAEDSDGEERGSSRKLKKSNCIMRALRDWYFAKRDAQQTDMTLSIIIPDFELFNKDVLRDLILTVSYYRSQIPLVLVFGVATTVHALENALPLQFTSKAKFHVFKSQSSINNLNSIVEKIVLDPRNHFLLSGKTLQLLVEIFLFYDFSITGFVQGLKVSGMTFCRRASFTPLSSFQFAMLEHFSGGTPYSLCEDLATAIARLDSLTGDDVDDIRGLLSVRAYVESRSDPQDIINLLCDEDYFVERLSTELLPGVYQFIDTFYIALRSLHVLMCDLPKSSYGKQVRELYCTATEGLDFESEEFQSTLNFLQFSTKSELVGKISQIVRLIEEYQNNVSTNSNHMNGVLVALKKYWRQIDESSTQMVDAAGAPAAAAPNLKVGSRQELKERLMEMSKQQQSQRSPYQVVAVEMLEFLRKEFFGRFLVPLRSGPPLVELFHFSDSQTLRKHIVGAPRAAVHQALLNPQHYLQCECCVLESATQLTPSQPDLSIVYKLHLECGKMINLYDWLQAFKAIVAQDQDGEDDESNGRNVDPVIL